MKRLLVIALLLFAACEKEKPAPEPPEPASRTFLLYLAMDNNLDRFAQDNIDGLLEGVERDGLNGGRILIYSDVRAAVPELLEIVLKKGNAELKTLKTYPEQNSADPAVLRAVLDEVKRLAPAAGYALDIGSHATGWLPGVYNIGSRTRMLNGVPMMLTRAVANDGSSWGELEGLADVLADGELEYLIFDACFMGGVESAFALRRKAAQIVASPAEILAVGMPYDQIVSDLMATTPRLEAVARKYFEFYDASSAPTGWEYGSWIRSATIALYDCSKLEALARAMLPVFAREQAAIAAMNTADIQHFNSYSQPHHFIFDIADFVEELIPATDPLYAAFATALAAAVPYKAATPRIMDYTAIDTYCGMGVYIPTEAPANAALNAAWRRTEWAQALLSAAN